MTAFPSNRHYAIVFAALVIGVLVAGGYAVMSASSLVRGPSTSPLRQTDDSTIADTSIAIMTVARHAYNNGAPLDEESSSWGDLDRQWVEEVVSLRTKGATPSDTTDSILLTSTYGTVLFPGDGSATVNLPMDSPLVLSASIGAAGAKDGSNVLRDEEVLSKVKYIRRGIEAYNLGMADAKDSDGPNTVEGSVLQTMINGGLSLRDTAEELQVVYFCSNAGQLLCTVTIDGGEAAAVEWIES